jgi:hypothetical protein
MVGHGMQVTDDCGIDAGVDRRGGNVLVEQLRADAA